MSSSRPGARKCVAAAGRGRGRDGGATASAAGSTGSKWCSGSMQRCELCGCCVPGNEQAWQTHTTGIRHRRNVASQRVFGEAGHAVVSAFEHVDSPPPATYCGKDVVLLAAQQQQQQAAAATAPFSRGRTGRQAAQQHDPSDQLQQLQRQLRKHLATQVGLGSVYSRAAERFTSDALAAAWQQLQASIAHQLRQQQLQQERPQPAAAAGQQPDAGAVQQLALQQAPQQPAKQQQQEQRGHQLELSLFDPAQVACLAHLLPESVTALKLTVPYQSYGPAAAATSAAVACFACSLGRQHSLASLVLAFSSGEYSRILQQGGASLRRLPELWGKAMESLTGAMQVNCGLRRLVLASFPCQFPPEALRALQVSLLVSRQRLRAALLAATHPRLGASSPLARLPRELLAALLGRAVPREHCSLHLELPQGLAGDSSDNNSSSSDSSSDSSSEDEGEEDSTSSGGSEDPDDSDSSDAE